MPPLIGRARAFRRSPHFKRLIKYASVSIIATIVTQTVLFLTYHVLTLASAMECNVLATAVSTIPAYYLNRTWTWRKGGKSDFWREVAPFWMISFVGLLLSTIAVGIAAHNADRISPSSDIRALVVQLANLSTYALIWVGRYMVFNRYLFGERTQGRYGSYSLESGDGVIDTAVGETAALLRDHATGSAGDVLSTPLVNDRAGARDRAELPGSPTRP
ncbi:MAG: GtrA family protein [Acidimicrobiales bacterium]